MEPKLLRVGRGERDKEDRINDIQVNHPSVSRSHLEVFIDPYNNIFVTDLQTRNGTFVNGNPVVGTILLKDGDILKLGSAKPVQWKKWLTGDFRDPDDQANPSPPIIPTIDKQDRLMMTTAGQKKQSSRRRFFLIALMLLIMLILGVFVWRFFPVPNETVSADSGEISIVYTRFDLESKDYLQLQQLIQQQVKVSNLSTGDWLITSDAKKVVLNIENNMLIGMQLLDESPSSKSIDTLSEAKSAPQKDTAKKTTTNTGDQDGDGIKDEDDHCINLSGSPFNGGCPIGYYEFKDNRNGYYEVKVLMGGESIRQFRERVSRIPTLNCNNPSEETEIILLNQSSLNEDNKKYGTLPGGYWIYFKCN